MGWCGLDWSGSGDWQVESSCKFSDEPSGSKLVAFQVVFSSVVVDI
jgi:hypothetical protein